MFGEVGSGPDQPPPTKPRLAVLELDGESGPLVLAAELEVPVVAFFRNFINVPFRFRPTRFVSSKSNTRGGGGGGAGGGADKVCGWVCVAGTLVFELGEDAAGSADSPTVVDLPRCGFESIDGIDGPLIETGFAFEGARKRAVVGVGLLPASDDEAVV